MKRAVALVIALLAPALAGCRRAAGEESDPGSSAPVPVTVEAAVTAEGPLQVDFPVRVIYDPRRHAQLQSPAAWVVEQVAVAPGDRVRSGAPLVMLRPDQPAAEELHKAGIARDAAIRERKRQEALVAAGAAPQSQLDDARSQESAAAAEEAAARRRTAYQSGASLLRAPFAGIVIAVDAVPGRLSDPARPLIELADLSQLLAEIRVPPEVAARLKRGLVATLQFGGVELPATVARVFPAPDEGTLQVAVWLSPAEPGRLAPGAVGNARLTLDAPAQGVWVSERAVAGERKSPEVFVIEGGRAVSRPVKTGPGREGRILITEGLKAGERVVVDGGWQLEDGSAVQIEAGREAVSAPAGAP